MQPRNSSTKECNPSCNSNATVGLKAAAEQLLQRNRQCNSYVTKNKNQRNFTTEKPWKRILNKAGIKNLRIHDLRRSLGSWQAATGANLSVIGKTLAHKNVSTTAIYARLNIDPIRESMNKAIDAMLSAAGIDSTETKS